MLDQPTNRRVLPRTLSLSFPWAEVREVREVRDHEGHESHEGREGS